MDILLTTLSQWQTAIIDTISFDPARLLEPEMIARIALQILLLIGSAFFSGSETALVHADKLKLHHRASQGHKGAKLVLHMFQRPEVLLGTTLMGTNLSVVALTTLGTLLMIRLLGDLGDLYAFLIYTPLFLILGEVVPKSVYQQKSDTIAPIVIYPLWACSLLFYPIVFLLARVARTAARLAGVRPETQELFINREQIRSIIEMAEQGANVDVFDRDRIMRVVRFADRTVNEAMIPIADMTMIGADATTRQAITLSRRQGHFRLPVYRDKTTDIVGAVSFTLWDLMDPGLSEQPLSSLIRPVHYVAPNQRLDQLLPLLQQRDDHMAIVVDEFGSAIGMLTLEDVIEEVAGEVINVGYNFDVHVPHHKFEVESRQEGVYMMSARMPLAEAGEALGIKLPTRQAHTLGGMITAHLGHIPAAGEFIYVQGFRFIVEEADERSALQLKIVAPHQRGQI